MAGVETCPGDWEPLPPGIQGCLCPQDLLPGLGQCIVAGRAGGGLTVVRADPAIAVSGKLLRDWHDAGTPPGISLECRLNPDHIGDLIRVETADRRVIYAVTRVRGDAWEARWPD
jgi:hypothetical protein